eukprot:4554583-Alexandrium_andersonii.AAC.1
MPMQYKFRCLGHVCHSARFVGNPLFYAVFEDETYNGKLVPIASAAYKAGWRRRALATFRAVRGDAAPKGKKR